MSLEITGMVTHVLDTQTGTSPKGDWKIQTFVVHEDKEKYPKHVAIDAKNKDWSINIGDKVKVSINIASREYNGKWYTNATAWKYDVIQPGAEVPPASNEPLEVDDLPF